MAIDIEHAQGIRMINVLLIGADLEAEHLRLSAETGISSELSVSGSMDEIVAHVGQQRSDIVIISEQQSPESADELCLLISLAHRDSQVMIVTDLHPDLERLRASAYKCRGYITNNQRHDLLKAIKVVHAGEAWLPRKLVADVLDYMSQQQPATMPFLKIVKS